jgi:hypothetical protein
LKKEFDVDIKFDNTLDFYNQLLNIDTNLTPNPLTFNEWLVANNIEFTEGEEQVIYQQYEDYVNNLQAGAPKYSSARLFYYGNKEPLKNTLISYYLLNEESVVGTPSEVLFQEINTFVKYDYIISNKLISSVLPTNSNFSLTPPNNKIKLSGLIDLFFLTFLLNLNDGDKAKIITQLNAAPDPTSGIDTKNEKTRKKQVEDRKKKIEATLTKIFNIIKTYTLAADAKLKTLHTNYSNNEQTVVKKTNKVLMDQEVDATFTSTAIAEKLLKGGVTDYTVVIKDTKRVKETAKYNYNIFLNTRLLFGIPTQSADPEIVEENKTTEFSKYKKENNIE